MHVVVLMEDSDRNNGLIAEHGLSLYVETVRHKLLVDTGSSNKTWENAKKLGIDIKKIDTVVISHGHYDHAGGLMGFAFENARAGIYIRRNAMGDFYHGDRYIGIDRRVQTLSNLCVVNEESRYTIDDELSLFAGITGRRLWPSGNRLLSERRMGQNIQDEFRHEQCLVINENEKKVLISGCAHNGILNILDRYVSLYGKLPDAVISGFHMMKKSTYDEKEILEIRETGRKLAESGVMFYTGHCTGEPAYEILKEVMGDKISHLYPGCEICVEQ